jgi:hypothetical protein
MIKAAISDEAAEFDDDVDWFCFEVDIDRGRSFSLVSSKAISAEAVMDGCINSKLEELSKIN